MNKCEICGNVEVVKLIDLNMLEGQEPLYYYACYDCCQLDKSEAVRLLNEEE